MELSGAEIVVQSLKDEGVEFVFGYPGGAEVVNMQPPDALIKAGINHLPTVGDGRQSGTSESPSILNASPESESYLLPRVASIEGWEPVLETASVRSPSCDALQVFCAYGIVEGSSAGLKRRLSR